MAMLRLVPASGSPIEVTRAESLVGRDPSCDVVIPDGSVSRRHARIERREDSWVVIDQGSANGTFVDSQKVAETAIRHGQEVRFGAVSFKVEVPGEEDLGKTVASPVLDEEATMLQEGPLPAPPAPGRAPGVPPLPKPPASPPPPPAPRPAASPPSVPPSAAAAKERFRPPAPPSGASPVPQMPAEGAGAAPPRKGRSPLFWIAGGCCGCLVIVVLLAGLLGGGLFFMTKGAADAAHAHVQQVRAGEIDRAYGGLAQSYRAEMSLQDFERLVAEHPGLRENVDATFSNRSVKNDTATISGVLVASSGPSEPVTFTLVREGGVWKISDIRFGAE